MSNTRSSNQVKTQAPVMFEGRAFPRVCMEYLFNKCVDGKCPKGYSHIWFCIHCANGECKFGDQCKETQAWQLTGKNGNVTNKTKYFWVIHNESTPDIYFYFRNRTVAQQEQEERQAAEANIKAAKAAEIAKKTVVASGSTLRYRSPIGALARDMESHMKDSFQYLEAIKADPSKLEVELTKFNKVRLAIKNALDSLTEYERSMKDAVHALLEDVDLESLDESTYQLAKLVFDETK